MDNPIKLMPEQNHYTVTVKQIQADFTLDTNTAIGLFEAMACNLRADVNVEEEKFKCKVTGVEFDPKKVKPGMIEPHAFIMIESIRHFIDWYSENYNTDLAQHVNKRIMEKKSDLYFSGINVELEGQDYGKIREIIDALCVRFYQELLMAITEYFATRHQAIITTPSENKDGYTFKFRNYNIIELDLLKKNGMLPINATE